jgi:hypothetical protein
VHLPWEPQGSQILCGPQLCLWLPAPCSGFRWREAQPERGQPDFCPLPTHLPKEIGCLSQFPCCCEPLPQDFFCLCCDHKKSEKNCCSCFEQLLWQQRKVYCSGLSIYLSTLYISVYLSLYMYIYLFRSVCIHVLYMYMQAYTNEHTHTHTHLSKQLKNCLSHRP